MPARLIHCAACTRDGQPHGARRAGVGDYCKPCYMRWYRAGHPDSGPPPALAESTRAPLRCPEGHRWRYRTTRTDTAGTRHCLVCERAAAAREVRDRVDALAAAGARPAPGWEQRAACREAPDREVFFAEDPTQARRWCLLCPARANCGLAAVLADERHGTWGGLSPGQRTRIRNRAASVRALTP